MSKNRKLYRELHSNWDQLPLFFRPWYLDAVCGSAWDVCISMDKGGNVQGILPYHEKKKYSISHITMPLLAPYLGPWLIYPPQKMKRASKLSFEKKVTTELLNQLPNHALIKMHCHPDLANVLPATFLGYETHVRYTYTHRKSEPSVLWEAVDSKQRNVIKTNEKRFEIYQSDNIERFYTLNEKSFARQSENIPYDLSFIQRLYAEIKKNNAGSLIFAKDQNGTIHSGVLIVYDQYSSYCLAIGNDPKYKNSGSLPVLIWEALIRSFDHTEVFNFEGGMIPNIEKFFRSFGGQLTPYYKIQKARNSILKGVFSVLNKI